MTGLNNSDDNDASWSARTAAGDSNSATVNNSEIDTINFGTRPMQVFISQYVKKHLRTAQAEINESVKPFGSIEASKWYFQGKFTKIICSNLQQVTNLLCVNKLCDQWIHVTLPRAITNNRPPPGKPKRSYIVFGISKEFPLEELLIYNKFAGKVFQERDETYAAILTPIDDVVDMPYYRIL